MPGERLGSYLERKTLHVNSPDLSALRLFLTTHDKAKYGCIVEYVTYMAVSGSLALKDEV